MKINKVIFNNFKCYVGLKEFDFNSDGNINIIMAQNGNGKTSFLEGILLAFYGCKMFSSDRFTNEYINFVTTRLSRDIVDNKMSVEIEYIDGGAKFNVKRSFIIEVDKIIDEDFSIYKDNIEVHSSEFLDNYDFSIVKRLFLDGEHITKIVDNNEIDKFVSEFIKVVFNLTVMEQIGSDLEKIERNILNSFQTSEHKSIENTVLNVESDLENLEKTISKNDMLISNLIHDIKNIEKQMKKRNLKNNKELTNLIIENENISKSNSKLNENLKTFVVNDLQTLMHKDVLKCYVNNLNDSRNSRLKEISKFLENIENVEVPSNYVDLVLEKTFMNQNRKVSIFDCKNVLDIIKELKRNEKQYQKNKEKIASTNKGKEELDILLNYDELTMQVEKLKNQNLMLFEKRDKRMNLLLQKQTELDKHKQTVMKMRISDNVLCEKEKLKTITNKYINVKMCEYSDLVAEKSLEILKRYFLRKNELIDDITFKNSVIKVYKDKKEVNYRNFSAGEKQMLIVSLIFSIIETADVKIPLVLDSFVGRLDNKHTENILKYLRESIKTQVIIVSTDHEMTKERIGYLNGNLGKCFELNNEGFSTHISEVTL